MNLFYQIPQLKRLKFNSRQRHEAAHHYPRARTPPHLSRGEEHPAVRHRGLSPGRHSEGRERGHGGEYAEEERWMEEFEETETMRRAKEAIMLLFHEDGELGYLKFDENPTIEERGGAFHIPKLETSGHMPPIHHGQTFEIHDPKLRYAPGEPAISKSPFFYWYTARRGNENGMELAARDPERTMWARGDAGGRRLVSVDEMASLRPLLRTIPRLSAARAAAAPALRRTYASEASGAPKSSSNALVYALGAAVVGGGAWYALGGEKSTDYRTVKDAASPEVVDYQKVYNAIAQVLESEDYDDGSYGPVLLRLAWHASGTFDKESGTGGSNGATMRFSPEADHGANAGLRIARDKLEPIKKQFPAITYGDLWTLAGVCAIQEMGGPYVAWRAGRKDGDVAGCTPDGRLPDGDKGADHVRKIFYRMGFNDQEIVALLGAHALGRCHTDRSGFDGPWTFSPTTVTNDYYKLLLEKKWNMRKWKGPPQYEDKDTKSLMMLIPDYTMSTDKSFKKYTELYAGDEAKFFEDFSKVITKLFELGVPTSQFSEVIPLKKTEDQTA
ncbi:cytochrome-c peroxidase [Pseudohyphozyma bogoriensis]|nr:cytochrome-c peroxidase [Pseudohyphozyma bogoriensis]